MDINDKNGKYAFLLGSSLRNDDANQFLDIYDSLLPKDISQTQVELIKEAARGIADLSEGDFVQLVSSSHNQELLLEVRNNLSCNRRPGSLVKRSQSLSASSVDDITMEAEECTNSGGDGRTVCRKPNIASLSRTSRHFVKNSDVSTTETEDGDQSDSGVFNSSKTTGSMSDPDLTDDGSEGRVGVLDYFQPQIDIKTAPVHNFGDHHHGKQGIIHRNERLHDMAYDEAFENDSATDIDSPRSGGDAYDTELQQIVIETPQILPNPSPRGNPAVEIDEGTELKTFNVSSFNQHAHNAHTEQYDEAHDVPSDDNDDIQTVHVHERLYGPHNSSGFASMDAEDDEEYEQEFSEQHAQAQRALGERTSFGTRYGNGGNIELPVKDRDFYHSGQISGPGGIGRSLRHDVDSSVTFPLSYVDSSTPVRRSYGTVPSSHDEYTVHRTSEGTYIKKDIMSKEPPFGNPLNQSRVERSMERLLDSRSGFNSKNSPPPRNMPVGEPIGSLEEGMGGVISSEKDKTTETNNRKKKKKKKNKDEDGTDNKSYDVNGNPIDYLTRDRESRTMRTSESTSKSLEHCGIRPWPTNSFPDYLSRFDTYNSPNTSGKIGELEDVPSSVSSARNEQEQTIRDKLQKRKAKKLEQEAKVTYANRIPGHRGDQDVEKLLDFITGNNNSKKSLKKRQLTGTSAFNSVPENGFVEKSNKAKNTVNGKMQSSSENGSEKEDDTCSKSNEISEEKIKISSDLVENAKLSDNGSEGSISSDLIKDITATAAKLDNNKHIKYPKGNKGDVEDTYSSGGEGPGNGSCVDIYPTALVNDTYIFTDYDSVSAPVEEDFVTVSAKKKKTRITGQFSNNYHRDNGFGNSQHYYSYRESSLSSVGDNRPFGSGAQLAQLPSKGEDRRMARSSRPMTRSVTPPPSSYSSSSQSVGSSDTSRRSCVNKASRDRAFSPSSILPQNKPEEDCDYPVIDNHSNDFPSLPNATSSHEGRRNSTGNVPSEVIPEVDSDMESVKSLPLASSNQTDGGSSPRGSATSNIISYARIAAAPRGGGKTMSMSNSTSTASVNSVPSSTVSNSTQNHGNQIADVTKQQDEGYVTTDNTVDSSLSNTVSASSSKSEELSSLTALDSNTTKPESNKLTSQCPNVIGENLTAAQREPEITKSCEKETGKTTAEVNSISNTVSIGDQSSCSGVSKTHKADVNKMKPVINDCATSGDDTMPDVAVSSSKSGATATKRTGKPKSSVVFLDRKMNNSPKHMEISFGFDEAIDKQSEGSEMQIQFGENVQGMQFGGPAMVYPAGEFMTTISSATPQDICSMKGAMPGLNGVINPQDMMPYPPHPHAIGIPVNLAQPPPAHLMVVPPPVTPTSDQMMMPPPTAQFIPPPAGVPPPQVVTSVPPPVPVAPFESQVVFGTDMSSAASHHDQAQNAFKPKLPAPPADVSNEMDFPPLIATVSKSVTPSTTSPVASVVDGEDLAVTAEPHGPVKTDKKQTSDRPGVKALQHGKADKEAGKVQQRQQMEVTVDNLKQFWPSREKDPNYDCGNFVVEQAVFYLQKEWDRVVARQKKHPEKVLTCSGV